MSIEDSFGTALLAQSSITSTLATLPGTASSPSVVPLQAVENFKNAFPRIIYTKTSDRPIYTDAGAASVAEAAFIVECQGQTIASVETVRNAVKTYLLTLGNSTTFGSLKLMHCFITDEYDEPHPAIHGEEIGIRAKTLEIELSYK